MGLVGGGGMGGGGPIPHLPDTALKERRWDGGLSVVLVSSWILMASAAHCRLRIILKT